MLLLCRMIKCYIKNRNFGAYPNQLLSASIGMKLMFIRKEIQSDVGAIFDITKTAFENHPYSNNTEQFIINALRAANALTVSLVVEVDGKLVGHIAFSPVTFSDGTEN